jgi:hypothetical protein
MNILRFLGLGKTEERLLGETRGTDGKPDRLDYVIIDRYGRERPAHRERFHTGQADRCPKCGGRVYDIYEYDGRISQKEGCDTWVAELKCERCHWKPDGNEACVEWYLGNLVYDDE